MRRRSTTRSKWSRGFDWDAASFTVDLQPGEIFCDWARVPSGSTDPLANDLFIRAKTLVKTLVYPHINGPVTPANDSFEFYMGLIAWDGPDATPPSQFPLPSNGAVDWLWWLPAGAFNPPGFSTVVWNNNFQDASYTGGLYSSAMRKLPESKGIALVMHYVAGPSGATGHIGVSVQLRMGLKGDVTAAGLGTQ